MTIPDLWDTIKYRWKKLKDIPLCIMEKIGSRMSTYSWQKRWGDRKRGTGYRKER
tara:strand:- start:234 stop:398 length:165 start_codon:yes stop_codon:yes gene_type:complete